MANSDKKKILMVDDDEIVLVSAKSILADDYIFYAAKSGKEAIDYFLQGQIPDLVLLDIMMPNMDGWETYNRLKAVSKLKDVPVAFVTSVTEASEQMRAQKLGIVDYILKPYKKEDLLDRVNKIFENILTTS